MQKSSCSKDGIEDLARLGPSNSLSQKVWVLIYSRAKEGKEGGAGSFPIALRAGKCK